MKKNTLFFLLLLFSIGLIIPISEQEESVTILADKQSEILYNVHSPKIVVKSDISNAIININITKINPINGEATKEKTFEFIGSKEIEQFEPGIYKLVFISDKLVEITIRGRGIYPSVIAIFSILVLINIIFTYQRYMN